MQVDGVDRDTGSVARIAPGKPVIAVEDLSLTFETGDGPVYALSDVQLTVNEGEFVSFIGPSGCGKTTLLRVIADLEQPTSGSILVYGVHAASRRGSGATTAMSSRRRRSIPGAPSSATSCCRSR